MKKSIIVAQSTCGAIGNRGKLPWHLPADLAHFKKITYGHPVIMGRLTFESIGFSLPGRTNIILTKQASYRRASCCIVMHDLQSAFAYAQDRNVAEVFVIGGSKVYEEALPIVDKIYMTQVHANVKGDRFFPHIDQNHWEQASRIDFSADLQNAYAYSFITYLRR